MKDFLKKMLNNKKAELDKLTARMKDSTEVTEVREVGETLLKLRDEIDSIEKQLANLEAEEKKPVEAEAETERSFNPMAMYNLNKTEKREEKKVGRDSMEYRQAFKDYVQKGIVSPILEKREDGPSTTTDLGGLIPI